MNERYIMIRDNELIFLIQQLHMQNKHNTIYMQSSPDTTKQKVTRLNMLE